jgi:diadenosine tetraphosphate (Ap4A) HIT family hydrolase
VNDLTPPCILCRGAAADPELGVVQVWEDSLWRVTLATDGEIAGFAHLVPKRHVPYITDLDGAEARTLGLVLAFVSHALKLATGAELVYVYIFGGGVPHLHLHLAPHRRGDALNDKMIRGESIETRLPSGFTRIVSKDFPPLPPNVHAQVVDRVKTLLANPPSWA